MAALLPLIGPSPASASTLYSPGCLDGGEQAKIKSVSDGLDLVLDDGRDLLLPGIDPVRKTEAQPDGANAAAAALSLWLSGQEVMVHALRAQPDRWGRTVALVFAPAPDSGQTTPTGARVSVIEAMIDAGFARAKPDATTSPCWKTDIAIEARTRGNRLGLWRDPYYAVIAAGDRAGLTAHTGTMAIVEGRITRIHEGRTRTYLGMSSDIGFAITVEKRTAARLARAGTDISTWSGKSIRVRGFLDDRFGLQIELSTLDQIEFLE